MFARMVSTSQPMAASAVTLRRAVESDLPAVLALIAELSPADPPMPLERAREIFARMQGTPRMAVWVVERDRVTIGTYTMHVMENLGHSGAPAGIVESVVVARELRGQGIGALMMRHAEAGCYKIALSSNRKRPDAHRFYRRLGFRDHGVSFAIDTP